MHRMQIAGARIGPLMQIAKSKCEEISLEIDGENNESNLSAEYKN
jgi:hypothetical protein